ncbi:isochorismatase family hydrolase [Lentinus tigrinus ALCF2SS1-7]|uniref:nicotinamidase n=1 Tax=Lentinus tigrinus ALCF2SS1-6 TaxID=1328759 RepID=A0A5C2SV04_9APHY|nr:isochorismatase family hydrolase [Lentinus tigrinus ALCF2SS1-6]RPD80882.1 isochorismatase family hydrolase [Lentinus tigrinus ALCF2SS1-7]
MPLVAPIFRPALILVDVQEDFCPPNGSLAVHEGRDIVPVLNDLLKLPFVLKIATKDHHPPDHVSFASNHPGATPFVSTTTIANPANPAETYETQLWPVHCVVGTPGNELLPELDHARIDAVIHKGTDPRIEMYSAFRSPLRDPPLASAVTDLEERLRAADVTDVFVVGLAGDFCVVSSALDAAQLGFATYVVEEGQRCVGGVEGWAKTRAQLEEKGVRVVHADGPEIEAVKALRL